jgi:DNA polymerase (family 10)
VSTGDSRYLDELQQATPEGLVEMLRIPGLGTAKIHTIHEKLGVESLADLEAAARDGRLAALPRFGERTAQRILTGIGFAREHGLRVLYPHGRAEAERLLAAVVRHPGVVRAEIAGSVRRHRETLGDADIVAECAKPPEKVAAAFAKRPGVADAERAGASLTIRFVDGARLDLHCVTPEQFPVALWRATGSASHLEEVRERAAERGFSFAHDRLLGADGAPVPLPDERALYAALGLAWVPPELREGRGELDAAARDALPALLEYDDLRGVLHCHSDYSDGKATIAEMAGAARARGWRYIGITDHSVSAFYAGGLKPDDVRRQHDEIDEVNAAATDGFRVLKGIEADILADGRVDYDDGTLDRFDYVIGSVHSRFGMAEAEMTARVCTALDDPRLTILGHPTGRLLLTREPYAIDMDAVIAKAAETGAAIELNADPHRLDLDWRMLHEARDRGVPIEIGPDAHSTNGLDYVRIGVGMARKGWLRAGDVLNTRSADEILAFARGRRARGRTT